MKMLAGECNLIALPNRSSNETEALFYHFPKSFPRKTAYSLQSYICIDVDYKN